MKHRAAIGLSGLGTDQKIDSDPLDKRAVGPDALNNHGAAAQARGRAHMHDHRALLVSNSHLITSLKTHLRTYLGVYLCLGPPLALPARGGLRETGIQVVA